MQNVFKLLLLTLWVFVGQSHSGIAQVTPSTTNQSSEYEELRKEGDDLFVQGRYEDAIRKYRVSIGGKAETDAYAKKKIEQSQSLIGLRNEAQTALRENRGAVAIDKWKSVLTQNGSDGTTKRLLGNYYGEIGNKALTQKNYEEAKANFALALSYDPDNSTWQVQRDISTQLASQNIQPKTEPVIAKPEPPAPHSTTPTTTVKATEPVVVQSRARVPEKGTAVRYKTNLVPKMLALLVGAGAGYYAYQLRTDYNTKLVALNQVSGRVDGDGDNVIIGSPAYAEWETAYNNAQAAYNKKGLATACIGVAAAAAVAEVYLFAKKRKPRQSALQVGAATDTYGVAMRFRLR